MVAVQRSRSPSSKQRKQQQPFMVSYQTIFYCFALLNGTVVILLSFAVGTYENDEDGLVSRAVQESPMVRTLLRQKRTIHWTDFHRPPDHHNETVDGSPLPGAYMDGLFFLLGARLSTSYEQDDANVSVNLLGFPGDFWKRKKEDVVRCQRHKELKGRLLKYIPVKRMVQMYFQIYCNATTLCGEPMKMEHIHTGASADVNQNNVTIIWKGDLTSFIDRSELFHEAQTNNKRALRVRFWVQQHADPRAEYDVEPELEHITHLTEVDIPLETRVVGLAGPQIGHSPVETQEVPEMPVTLCASTFGTGIQKYFPQWIQHHLNLGFGHIIIGIDATMGSLDVEEAQRLLAPYIERGQVMLAAIGVKDIQCEVNIQKTHFYNTCLYHAKGISEYVAIWDIDELWIPPTVRKRNRILDWQPQTKLERPSYLLEDRIWKEGNYSRFASIVDAMTAISLYQEDFGCADMWCYHSFLSLNVFRRRVEGSYDDYVPRNFLLSHDFERVDSEYDDIWAKSVARTKVANMGFVHQPGSCRPIGSTKFIHRDYQEWNMNPYDHEYHEICRNLKLEGFGDIHHFYTLMSERGQYEVDGYDDSLKVGAYRRYFAGTVEAQLLALGLFHPAPDQAEA